MKFFNEPSIEIEEFEMVDVITVSGDEEPVVTEPVWGGGDEDMWG